MNQRRDHSVILRVPSDHQEVQHWPGLLLGTIFARLAFLKDFLFWLTTFILWRGYVLGGEDVLPGLNGIFFASVWALNINFGLDFSFGDFNFPHWFLLLLFDFDCWFPLVFPLKI